MHLFYGHEEPKNQNNDCHWTPNLHPEYIPLFKDNHSGFGDPPHECTGLEEKMDA